MTRYIPVFLLCLMILSCKPETYTPKPRGFYQVEFPQHQYRLFDMPGYPYTFEYPVYANIIKDTVYFDKKPENPWWINVDFPTIGGRIYLSYKQISSTQTISKLLEDAHRLTYYHDKRADYIEPKETNNQYGVHCLLYSVGGNAASAYQFIATDTMQHFIRGALYFDVTPNADSLRPMNEFLKDDMEHMMMTMKWR